MRRSRPRAAKTSRAARALKTLVVTLLLLPSQTQAAGGQGAAPSSPSQSAAARTPSDVVREFYRLMRARRFGEAFALSAYGPAFAELKPDEFEELRPDFEKIATTVLEQVVINGEQLSGDAATVFARVTEEDLAEASPRPVTLYRDGGAWLVGDAASAAEIKRQGKRFFFEQRIATHHEEVEKLLRRLPAVQLIYASRHNGLYGDLPALVRAGLMPADTLTPESTGYHIRVEPSKDGKSYTASAEPTRHNRTGRLSFLLDSGGNLRSKDNRGKPLKK